MGTVARLRGGPDAEGGARRDAAGFRLSQSFRSRCLASDCECMQPLILVSAWSTWYGRPYAQQPADRP